VRSQARREAVGVLTAERSLSVTRACGLVGISPSLYGYRSRRSPALELKGRIAELAAAQRRYGYRRIHDLLRGEGWSVNHKRRYRLYREQGLMVRKRKRKRIEIAERLVRVAPSAPNQSWSMDYVADALIDGRKLRALTIVDDFTRECLVIEVDTSLPGSRVVAVLERLRDLRGLPRSITVDHGPEFEGRLLDAWAYERGVDLAFVRPGKPRDNCCIESFNGRFRDECLNEHWFITMAHARAVIEAWRIEYNTERTHSSLGNLTPQDHELPAHRDAFADLHGAAFARGGARQRRGAARAASLSRDRGGRALLGRVPGFVRCASGPGQGCA
jgi:putative transposase